jgi:hypothetical protein
MPLTAASDVIAAVEATGARVVADGDLLRIRPASRVPAALVAALRRRKTEILVILQSEAERRALRCAISVLTVPDFRLCPHCFGTDTKIHRNRQVCARCS